MKLVSLDLEMNQPSKKIIQIGWCVGDSRTGKILQQDRVYVNPNEELNPEIIELTGINQSHVDHAHQLLGAYQYMLSRLAEIPQVHKLGVAWGDGDFRTLRMQLGMHEDDYFFKHNFINVKGMWQAYSVSNGLTMIGGLGKATKTLFGGFNGRQHDAMDDAINTWMVFAELNKKWKICDRVIKSINI